MLTAAAFDQLSTPIVDLYEQYMSSVIADISRRLAKMGKVTASAAWQMQRLTESGAVYQNALRELSKITGQSEATLRATFEAAGVRAMRWDDRIYKLAGLKPLPLNLSPAMLNVLLAGLSKTGGAIQNLTLTTALSAQRAFVDAADLAYMQVTTGSMRYDQAIRAAVKNVAAQGLNVIQYGGKTDALDVAMRRTVLTGVGQTTGALQMQRADEMNTDLVAVSAHAGARNRGEGPMNHESWQGKVYSRSGTSKKYGDFYAITGYGTGEGLSGWNCRHSFGPFFEGLSENAYDRQQLAEMNNATVEYNGKKISAYDASQIQRNVERKIRYWKRQQSALESASLDATGEHAKVLEWQKNMRDFIAQTKLFRQRVREQVV